MSIKKIINNIQFDKTILIKAEATIHSEHIEKWVYVKPLVGPIDMLSFEYPISAFKDFVVVKIENNSVKIRHLDTVFVIDLKTSQTFGEIIKKETNNGTDYGCMQITLSLQ